MGNIYENGMICNSFHAINADTLEVIPCGDDGSITLAEGDKVIFENPYQPGNYMTLNTLIFKAADTAMKIQLNDNEMYPLFIEAGEMKGVQYMGVVHFTALTGGKIYYEGLSA